MTNILAILFGVLVGLATTVFTLGLLMPFVGTLVRYRATYTPKAGAVHLDGEDGLAATPRSDSPSYFGMMKRVYRIEGLNGLYKGLMPSIIASLIAMMVFIPVSLVLASGLTVLPNGRVQLPAEGTLLMWSIGFALSVIPALLFIPMQIIIDRAITTPHKLAAFDAPAALRALLSPAERAQPLRLYLAPGVAPALLLEALVSPAVGLLRYFVAPRLPLAAALGAALPILLLVTAFVTPLMVLTTRLEIQRRGPEPPTFEAALVPEKEEVVDFRSTAAGVAPYTGLVDCARKVVEEEGWGVLARAWWVTALLTLVPLLVPMVMPEVPPGAPPPSVFYSAPPSF
ncbi:hypothetical protein B0H17DRAFT_1205890 [Mycena rosella]|uniref:Mitochondrial carrier n=1 Tax=Mycena rosella TaxID=1033263 RepID=A0AAD7D665_MYCRO|nr:hypothetical protein B0H17DRAFT_1205890 [Mycena rosella]